MRSVHVLVTICIALLCLLHHISGDTFIEHAWKTIRVESFEICYKWLAPPDKGPPHQLSSWEVCKKECMDRGASLPVLDTDDKCYSFNKYYETLFSSSPSSRWQTHMHIGLYFRLGDRPFYDYCDSAKLDYRNWAWVDGGLPSQAKFIPGSTWNRWHDDGGTRCTNLMDEPCFAEGWDYVITFKGGCKLSTTKGDDRRSSGCVCQNPCGKAVDYKTPLPLPTITCRRGPAKPLTIPPLPPTQPPAPRFTQPRPPPVSHPHVPPPIVTTPPLKTPPPGHATSKDPPIRNQSTTAPASGIGTLALVLILLGVFLLFLLVVCFIMGNKSRKKRGSGGKHHHSKRSHGDATGTSPRSVSACGSFSKSSGRSVSARNDPYWYSATSRTNL